MKFSRRLVCLVTASICVQGTTTANDTRAKCESSPVYVAASSIFDQLNDVEIRTTSEFIASELGLIATDEEPSIYDCDSAQRIYKVEKFPMVKAEALAYLDKEGSVPARYAKVTVVHAPIEVMEYKVGPLPITTESTITAMLATGTIAWNSRPQFQCEVDKVREFAIRPTSAIMKDLIVSMTNGFCFEEAECKPGKIHCVHKSCQTEKC
jgi:hypothetical protein